MLLNLEESSVPMKRVYLLSEELKQNLQGQPPVLSQSRVPVPIAEPVASRPRFSAPGAT
jgi:hypothetical protein